MSLDTEDGLPLPLWLKAEGSFAVINSLSMLDQEASVNIVVTLETESGPETGVFEVTLICDSSECNKDSREPQALPEVGCDGGQPSYLDE